MALFLEEAVKARKNILVAGGTGSGKTTLLNVLSQFIPEGERVITVEDSAELKLTHPNLVNLEARPANIEGKGRITIRDLVINTLRMRPDRIIVGECRGAEALDMLQAMNTGHDGSLTTAHANNPRDALTRLENMVMMAGFELPSSAIREQIASALDLIVQQTRMVDGSRKVVKITEITGREGNQILMQDIFTFEQTGLDEKGRVQGYHTATGNIPQFVDEMRRSGRLNLDMSVFVPKV
jgi:pilus assembly protein CpaF